MIQLVAQWLESAKKTGGVDYGDIAVSIKETEVENGEKTTTMALMMTPM